MTEHAKTSRMIHIGHRVAIPWETAVSWLTAYTDEAVNESSATKKPYAYPAYDTYNSDQNDVDKLADSDLLAPILLNVSISLKTYYGLQRVRSEVETALARIDPHLNLADDQVSDSQITTLVKPLYAVLDDPGSRPAGVRSTTLSKILHRKRPHFLVLHDKWIRRCYWGEDENAKVKRDKSRSASDYMVAISQAIAADIKTQRELFQELAERLPSATHLSDLRILDILAWTSQGKQPVESSPSA